MSELRRDLQGDARNQFARIIARFHRVWQQKLPVGANACRVYNGLVIAEFPTPQTPKRGQMRVPNFA